MNWLNESTEIDPIGTIAWLSKDQRTQTYIDIHLNEWAANYNKTLSQRHNEPKNQSGIATFYMQFDYIFIANCAFYFLFPSSKLTPILNAFIGQ